MKQISSILILIATLTFIPTQLFAKPVKQAYTEAELVTDIKTVQPGHSFWIALKLKMDEGWHTYWQNPGDSGLATSIKWNLPEGFTADNIQWPFPKVFKSSGLITYGYDGDVFLLSKITPPKVLQADSQHTLKARAQWLACAKICVPGRADLELSLSVSTDTPEINQEIQQLFKTIQNKWPITKSDWNVQSGQDKKNIYLHLTSTNEYSDNLTNISFFPLDSTAFNFSGFKKVTPNNNIYKLPITQPTTFEGNIKKIEGVLVFQNEWEEGVVQQILSINVPIN